jgi:hypothetical protein
MLISRMAIVALLVASCSAGGDPNGSGGGGQGGGDDPTGGKTGTGGRTGGSGGGSPGSGGTTAGSGGATTGSGGASSGGSSGASGGTGGTSPSPDAAAAADSGAAKDSGSMPTTDASASDFPPLPPPGNSPITQGFTMTPFTYNIQSPYKVPQSERYTYDKATDTHICWVKSDDSSFQAGNGTDPRTELRWQEEWTSGQHMLDSDVWIAGTTDRTNIVQVFSTTPPTTFMLTAWADKTLRYYFGTGNGPIIMKDAFEHWFNLKVLHNVSTHRVTVYINDVESMSFADKGSHWHFKNGNYGCRSQRCETRWRNLRYWVKN